MGEANAHKRLVRLLMVGALLFVVTVTIAILIPTPSTIVRNPRSYCSTKLATIRTCLHIYASDYSDKLPPATNWCDLLSKVCDMNLSDFRCPADKEGPCSYAMNKNAAELGKDMPPDVVLLFESKSGWNLVGGPELLNTQNHEGDGCTILFGDGHVEFVKTERLGELNWGRE
jgi:prepilin-type processing-associated H-X9-DG protein